jgi:hypothetical protein
MQPHELQGGQHGGQRVPQLVAEDGEEVVFGAARALRFSLQPFDLFAGPHLVGDVEAHGQDALDLAVHGAERGIDEVEVERLDAAVRAAELDRRTLAHVRYSGVAHAIEKALDSLIAQLGQRGQHRLADDLGQRPVPYTAGVGIRQLDDVLGPTNDRDRRGGIGEEGDEVLFLQLRLALGAIERRQPFRASPRFVPRTLGVDRARHLSGHQLEEGEVLVVVAQARAQAEDEGAPAGVGLRSADRQRDDGAPGLRGERLPPLHGAGVERSLGHVGDGGGVGVATEGVVTARELEPARGFVPEIDEERRHVRRVRGQGLGHVRHRVRRVRPGGEGAQRVRSALAQHRVGDLDHRLQDAGDPAAVITKGAEREAEIGLFREAVTGDGDVCAVHPDDLAAGEHLLHPGIDEGMGVGPALAVGCGQVAGVARSHDHGVAVVVELNLVGAPEDDRRGRQLQKHADVVHQARRPGLDRTQRRRRPVVGAHARGQLAVAGECSLQIDCRQRLRARDNGTSTPA